VAHRDGTAEHVDLCGVEVEVALELHHHRRKSLVDLVKVDVLRREPGPLECLAGGGCRSGEHDRRLAADDGGGHDAGARGETEVAADLLIADQHGRGAVNNAGGVAPGVHVVDPLDLRVAVDGHGVEADVALVDEAGAELAENLGGGVGPDGLVAVQQQGADPVAHGDDGAVEVPRVPAESGALVRDGGVGVDVVAAEALQGGDETAPTP